MQLLQQTITIPAGATEVQGDMVLPPDARAVVVFAHGNAGSRRSQRNLFIAGVLQQAAIGTLLIDLFTPEEEESDARNADFRFNVTLFTDRVCAAVDWLHGQPATCSLEIGVYGAGTGGGAALEAAATRPELIHAVVSRGGRPDLAGDYLSLVKAPTLLIVGEKDGNAVEANRQALSLMHGQAELQLVAGAGHLFEESGALDQVALLTCDWFIRHFSEVPAEV